MHLVRIGIYSDRYPTEGIYPFNVAALRNTSELILRKPVVFFEGENGTGKSTLLEAITRKCGIHMWDKPKRHLAHENPYETCLVDYVDVTWINGHVPGSLFKAETFSGFADFLDDVALCDPGRMRYHGGQLLNVLSHGEGIMSYFSTRYSIPGIYLLDEPESALSPFSQARFLILLRALEDAGHAQFIMASHSPILLSYPGAQIFSFDGERVQEVSYRETRTYKLYEQFFRHEDGLINNSARM